MTNDKKSPNDGEHITDVSRGAADNGDKAEADAGDRVHNGPRNSDSMFEPEDVAERFLRDCINEVRSELAKKRKQAQRADEVRTADAELIGFISSYAAAHRDPQYFLRRLKEALCSLGDLDLDVEQTDA